MNRGQVTWLRFPRGDQYIDMTWWDPGYVRVFRILRERFGRFGLRRQWNPQGAIVVDEAFVGDKIHGKRVRFVEVTWHWRGIQISESEYRERLPKPADLHQTLRISPVVAQHVCKFV